MHPKNRRGGAPALLGGWLAAWLAACGPGADLPSTDRDRDPGAAGASFAAGKADGPLRGWVRCAAARCDVLRATNPLAGPGPADGPRQVARGEQLEVYAQTDEHVVVSPPADAPDHAVELVARAAVSAGAWELVGVPMPPEAVVCTRDAGCPVYRTADLVDPRAVYVETVPRWTAREVRAWRGNVRVVSVPEPWRGNAVRTVVVGEDGWRAPRLAVPFLTQQPQQAACAAAALAMALQHYGHPVSVSEAYDWFVREGHVDSKGYVRGERLPEAARALSGGDVWAWIHWWQSPGLGDLKAHLNRGLPVHVFVDHGAMPGSGITTSTPHSVLVTGYEDQTFSYHNPWQSSGGSTINATALDKALLVRAGASYFQPGPLGELIAALDARDVERALAVYHEQAVVVRPDRTRAGRDAIREWLRQLLDEQLLHARFSLRGVLGRGAARELLWTAAGPLATAKDGHDWVILLDGKIVYHSPTFTLTPALPYE